MELTMTPAQRMTQLLIAAVLLIVSLSLAGCRQDEATATPEAKPKAQQMLPLAGSGSDSPLPTPGTGQAPLQP